MITLRLYLENIADHWFGWIEGFPGAFSQGATSRDAEISASHAFADYLSWLKRHGEPIPYEFTNTISAEFVPFVVETVPQEAAALWQAHGFLPGEHSALQTYELDPYFRWLQHARADLVNAAKIIPPHEWDTAPLGGKSIRSLMLSLSEAEIQMLSRMGLEPTYQPHRDPLMTITRTRTAFEYSMRDLHERGRHQAVDDAGAKWSLRKILRQTLCYERHLYDKIRARSNPAAYLDAVSRTSEAVIFQRSDARRSEHISTQADEETEPRSKHTHVSAYYY